MITRVMYTKIWQIYYCEHLSINEIMTYKSVTEYDKEVIESTRDALLSIKEQSGLAS